MASTVLAAWLLAWGPQSDDQPQILLRQDATAIDAVGDAFGLTAGERACCWPPAAARAC